MKLDIEDNSLRELIKNEKNILEEAGLVLLVILLLEFP